MPKLKKDKLIWVRQSFGENDLWRYEKIKVADYNKFLESEIEMGEKNPFLKMVPAGKLIVAYKSVIEFLQKQVRRQNNLYCNRLLSQNHT